MKKIFLFISLSPFLIAAANLNCNKDKMPKANRYRPSQALRKQEYILSPQNAFERANKAAQAIVESVTPNLLTLPFPKKWPPGADKIIVYFAYQRVPLSTSTVQYQVYSPFLRIEIDLVDSTNANTKVKRLNPGKLKTPERRSSQTLQGGAIENAEKTLFEWIVFSDKAKVNPNDKAVKELRRIYLAWMREHAALANELRKSFAEFFMWLEEKP
jgi:hypothetical protein